MENMVIGIEGLVGSGKTSICRELLNFIPNSIILHGGNFYRVIVYALFQSAKNMDFSSFKENIHNVDIKQLMENLKVEFKIEDRETVFYIDGIKIDDEKLQSIENSIAVSVAGKEANSTRLYEFARNLIDMYKQKYNVIVSGRDLMKIYPNLDYHLFITADLEERVKRKMKQYHNEVDYNIVKQNIVERDALQEKSGYYKIYDKTIKIDVTNCKTIEESTNEVLKHINIKNR